MLFGFNGMLAILGAVLCIGKILGLGGLETASWVWVSCPLWIGFVLDLIIIIGFTIYNLTHIDSTTKVEDVFGEDED